MFYNRIENISKAELQASKAAPEYAERSWVMEFRAPEAKAQEMKKEKKARKAEAAAGANKKTISNKPTRR